MGVWYRAYLMLGWKIDKKEEAELADQIEHELFEKENFALDYVLDCMCGRYLVIGREIKCVSHDNEDEFYKIDPPTEEDRTAVRETLKEKYGFDLGDPDFLFFWHGD